ncbi:MAG: metallopeptidase TldD-related protein [Planctomycetota bacterium]|nr:metallopeptidase TldD-related protein [Planctomycetota bacterium]
MLENNRDRARGWRRTARSLGRFACSGLALVLVGTGSVASAQTLDEEPIYKAMNDEMIRSMARLKMENLEGPYYLEYIVRDTESAAAAASFGGLTSSRQTRGRALYTDLRVGDYEFDNTNYVSGGGMFSFFMGAAGRGGRGRPLPLDDDYEATRHAIWLDTDRAYKTALEVLADKQAVVKTSNLTDRPADFSVAEPNEHIGKTLKLSADTKAWEDTVRRLSAIFREFPLIQTSSVTWGAGVTNQYFVNNEGSRHRWGRGVASITVAATAQADDGMRLADTLTIRRPIDSGLPAEEKIAEEIRSFANDLAARAKASSPEDYTGPVLFEGGAATELFDRLFVQNVSNPRIPLFENSGGFRDFGGASLAQRVGSRVLPKEFDVFDDPGLTAWEGEPLLGSYPVDDDGLAPQKVSLVEGGKLKTLLMSRVPTDKVQGSNGHGRGIGRATGAPGNVVIKSSAPKSDKELRESLIEMCREMDLEYGIIVRKNISGAAARGFGGGGRRRRGGRGFGGGFRGGNMESRLVAYRVYVEDGREEPTRGLMIQELSDATLRDIVAAGETQAVSHVSRAGAMASIVAPAVLVEEIDLRKPPRQRAKKPYIEHPAF